jgi:hypothetical protein
LKAKLLNGIPWEELVVTRKNITELAIAIHKSSHYKVADSIEPVSSNDKNASA